MKLFKKCSASILAATMIMSVAATAAACTSPEPEIPEHEHTYSSVYTYDSNNHWYYCTAVSGCKSTDGFGPHDFAQGTTCTCGYVQGTTPNPNPTPTPGVTHTVTYVTNVPNVTLPSDSVSSGGTLTKPSIEYAGHYLVGWYTTENCTGTPFNFTSGVTKNLTLYAKWAELDASIKIVSSYDESLAVEWSEGAPGSASVQYQSKDGGDWVSVDKQLIRAVDSTTARVDIVGLKAGSYKVKITASSGTSIDVPEVAVTAYDRSGYAHFNYTDGIGAYNDDGTLKDNAVVIYVTDQNKDTVMKEVAEKYSSVTMFKVPGSDWGNKDADGIGWWLNNAQYTKTDSKGNQGNTWVSNGNSLGFKSVDCPIVIRFIGTVTTPEGCTAYNSLNEGGSVGDNGHMARMRNYKNITLEGIGEDAQIKGWGFHFMTGSDATGGQGKSFEVRNLTFNEYPEDAVGMEGVQEGGKITGSVERCWVHHNTFLPGYCASPAESDKKEGDGSCDFKRGQYFTASYNYFEYCHKTNLVGSSDSSLQFNLTYHHNWWYQCGSRIPLTRKANVHFYNNYVNGDATEKTTPYSHIAKPALSYVHSLRADCYLFSEANYYDGCKNVTDGKSGGAGKAYNNMYFSCFDSNTLTNVTEREQKVSNSCKYDTTDYSSFDTNPAQFYYDAANKKSACFLQDAASARKTVMQNAGVHGFGRTDTSMVKEVPSASVNVKDEGETTIALKSGPATENGVLITSACKLSSGALKGRGQMLVFTLASEAQLTVSSSTSGDPAPQLLRADGTVIGDKFTSLTVVLPAGTYMIASGQKDKDCLITAMSFANTGASSAARIEAATEAINALASNVTAADAKAVAAAQQAYNALTEKEKSEFDASLKTKLENAVAAIDTILVNDVIAKINKIGTVTKDSGDDITAAQEAYNALTATQKGKVTNYSTLTKALADWSKFAVESVNEQITALADVSKISVTDKQAILDAKAAYEKVQNAYNNLDDGKDEGETDQQAQVTGYEKVTNGLATLAQLEKLFDFKDDLAAFEGTTVTSANASAARALKALYTELTSDQQNALTSDEKTTYNAIADSLKDYASKAVVAIFTKNDEKLASNAGFTVNGKKGYKGTSQTFTYDGKGYDSPLKLQSGDTVTFSTEVTMDLTLMLHSGGSQKIVVDGKSYTADANGLVTVSNLTAGSHTIGRDGEGWLCYATLTPAA